MDTALTIAEDVVWIEDSQGEVFAGVAPHGPVMHLTGAGSLIFLTLQGAPRPLCVNDVVDAFLPVAGLPEEELRHQVVTFVDDMQKAGMVTPAPAVTSSW